MFVFMLTDNLTQDTMMYRFSKAIARLTVDHTRYELLMLEDFFIENRYDSKDHSFIGRSIFNSGHELEKYL